jgi:hypothetical protein
MKRRNIISFSSELNSFLFLTPYLVSTITACTRAAFENGWSNNRHVLPVVGRFLSWQHGRNNKMRWKREDRNSSSKKKINSKIQQQPKKINHPVWCKRARKTNQWTGQTTKECNRRRPRSKSIPTANHRLGRTPFRVEANSQRYQQQNRMAFVALLRRRLLVVAFLATKKSPDSRPFIAWSEIPERPCIATKRRIRKNRPSSCSVWFRAASCSWEHKWSIENAFLQTR